MLQQPLTDLKSQLTGDVVLPDSPQYDTLRNAFNQTGSPSAIALVKTNDDVAAAIRYARENNLTLSVRSGGHSPNGLSTNVGGLVIDLANFNSVEVIDSVRHLVRIGAGAKWGAAAEALAAHGLAISSGDTKSVGVGGLTLGGGIGWMVRKHGLTIDSLEAAEIVTADGRTLRASAQENADLFWALRGGGGNFGVVTSFEFRAQPVKDVFGGLITYGIGELSGVLTKWADYMRTAPEELSTTFVIFPGFGQQMPAQVMLYLCYGSEDETAANAAIKPLLELGKPLHQDIKKEPYYKMLEDAMAPAGIKAVSENGFVKTLNKDVLDALSTNYGKPGAAIVQLRSLGGAVSRVSADATAFAHRDYEAMIIVASLVPVDMPKEQVTNAIHQAWNPLKPFVSGAYINFLSGTDAHSIAAAYPSATLSRLASVKAAYDPDNVFNQNLNIKPERTPA